MAWIKRHWRWLLSACIIAALGAFVYYHHEEIAEVGRTLRTAELGWVAAALLTQGLVYLCFSTVYWRSLRLLGYRVPLLSLYGVSFVAIFFGRAFPAGGTSVFAFLLYQLRRRGVPDGTGALAVTMDGLSYLIAFFVLLAGGFVYLFTHGELKVNDVLIVAMIVLAIIMLGMYVWGLSRDRVQLTRQALRLKNGIARLLRRQWGDTRVLAFIAELYEGGALIGRERSGFIQLVALHLVALLIDCVSLQLLFFAVGEGPHFSVVVLGYSLAYFLSTVSSLPGGGGTFEATMALTMSGLGIDGPVALSVTLLYRLITLWLPLLISLLIYRSVHNHRDTDRPPATTQPLDIRNERI
jgi:glycosyltransferase 2 family protein